MEIKFDKKNYRKHSEQNKNRIKKSLKECGAGRSVLVDADDTLIAGNGVFEQAQAMGIPTRVIETDGTELVVVKRTDLRTDDDKRKLLAMADNATSDNVEWDMETLQDDFDVDVLEDWDIDVNLSVEQEPQEANEDDFDEEKDNVSTICQEGDVWQLGEHRLMCGDSTNAEEVERLMDGNRAAILMTDPPYGINAEKMTLGTGKRDFHRGNWDSERPDISLAIANADKHCIWGGNYFADRLPVTNDWLCWHKKNDGLSFSEFELAWTDFGKNCRILSHHWGSEKKLHPTMKPIAVIAWALDISKTEGSVLDLFGGSGSTLIAAEQLGRKCYMMELDPHYCDVIIARWEKLTGKKAVKL